MEKLRITFNDHSLEFDKNYGCENRTGWSICDNGCYIVQLEPKIRWALFKYWLFKLFESALLSND